MKSIQSFPLIVLLAILSLAITQCNKDQNPSGPIVKDIKGYAEKGPFNNGSSIIVYDLLSNLSQTGKSFNSQMINHKGEFEINDISLSSSYILLRADGYYFNEVLGKNSEAPITLYSVADVADHSEVNINILTHLEKARVEFLIKNGQNFIDAKKQAQREILSIFNISKPQLRISDQLKISESDEDNGVLLAVSAIIQGFRSESEMSELLSNLSNDLKGDGKLDDVIIGSQLLSHAVKLDTIAIRKKLERRYAEIGANIEVPDFGKHIQHFIDNSNFEIQPIVISYPDEGLYGENILSISKTNFQAGLENPLSFSANILKGADLKIKISSLNANSDSTWVYVFNSKINWLVSDFDMEKRTQTFTVLESGKNSDLQMFFEEGSYLIEYFEMNALTPTRSKTIYCKH